MWLLILQRCADEVTGDSPGSEVTGDSPLGGASAKLMLANANVNVDLIRRAFDVLVPYLSGK